MKLNLSHKDVCINTELNNAGLSLFKQIKIVIKQLMEDLQSSLKLLAIQ